MRVHRILVAAILFAALFVFATPRPAEGSWNVSVSFFHEQLSPYGRWVVAGSYGHCWVPTSLAASWSPYLDGEWIWTDYGWTWVSYDPWGEIPYHYGTWVWVDPYGWVWVPGTIWAPAWVTWAYTDEYIGWAPVPPSFVLTARGYSGRPVVVPQRYYCFVPARQFVGVNVATVRVPVHQNPTIFTQARKTTSYTVSGGIVRTAGPPPSRIERIVGRPIERVSIDRAKAKPVPLSAAGMAKAHSLRVVAPASERARAIHAVSRDLGGKRSEAQANISKHEKAAATSPKNERAASPPRHEQPQPRVAKKQESKPEQATAAVRPRPEPRRQAPPEVKSAQKPQHEKAPASSQRHEETRVAAGTGHRAPAAAGPRHEQQPKHEQPQTAAAPPRAPAQPPPGQVKREQQAAAKAQPAPQRGQGQEKKKEKEKQ